VSYLLAVFVILLFSEPVLSQGAPASKAIAQLNPDISLDGLFAAGYFSEEDHLNFGGHDPNQTGFTLQNLELTLGAAVDPYARADAHIIYLINAEGESELEVEEAYLTTLALPSRLQLIGGQFFTRFGRINSMHPHAWDFADQPVIHNRLLGPDGLRNPGAQLSWLAPLPFYLELIGSVQNAGGETAVSFLSAQEPFEERFPDLPFEPREVRRFEDLLYMTRLRTAWAPSETAEILQGISGLFGPNPTGEETDTRILGLDLYAKWRPLTARRGWPFAAVQAEVLWRRYETGTDASGSLYDRGFYVQALWGMTDRWVAGLRWDHTKGEDSEDPLRDRRSRLSPNLTFYPSEFSKWRLQYNYDRAEHLENGPIHAVFLQFEFLIGAHGAHLF
jgi:hypothetical protein